MTATELLKLIATSSIDTGTTGTFYVKSKIISPLVLRQVSTFKRQLQKFQPNAQGNKAV
jgi:hypothetical protein